ncbi:hypothetical protein ABGB17_10585 [Sphaerisporangium sp. B11E5]|uniref:hypothetical protein n=1 Tax=Sphaerisporangium sp. B11E5 TaxID=3153563 RepID=UPI00325C3FE3
MIALSRVLGAATVASAVLLASGCGGVAAGTAGAQVSPAGAQASPVGDGRAAFAECMREHGVTLPTGRPGGAPTARPDGAPSGGPSGRPWGFGAMGPEARKALEACRSLMPQGGPARAGGPRGGVNAGVLQAFRTCMKDNGAEITGENLRDLTETDDPKVAAALKKCRPLLLARAPGTPAPGATPAPSASTGD